MKIIRYEAHNVLGVRDIEFEMEGRHLFLVGGANGQGKTSALTALVMTLAGKSGMKGYPEVALRSGEKRGKVIVELTGDEDMQDGQGFTAELSWRKKNSGVIEEDFRLLDSTGAEAPEPRTLLKRLFNLKAFDPLEFARMKPKEQATCVQQMLGLDLSKYDRERDEKFADRTVLGREGKKLAAQLEGMTKHRDAPKHEIKVGDLMAAIDAITSAQEDRRIQAEAIEAARQEMKQCEDSVSQAEGEIGRLAAKLDEAKKVLTARLKSRKEQEHVVKSEEEALDTLPDRSEELQPIRDQITQADDINAKVRGNVAYDALAAEVKRSRGKYQELSDRLKEIDEERAAEVAAADWPIEGMTLEEDGLLWNGLPFEQASTRETIMASMHVGMRLNPKLRLLVCQHGSDLDSETLDALDGILKENDFQAIFEIVTRTEEDEERCAVVISDGSVVGVEAAGV
jgi:DNA repair exonuclease SbcCD ATPase subunit